MMTRNNAHAQVEDAEAQARAAGTLSEICIKNAGIKTKIANSGAFLGLSKLVGTNGSSSYDIVLQRLAGEFLSPAFWFSPFLRLVLMVVPLGTCFPAIIITS